MLAHVGAKWILQSWRGKHVDELKQEVLELKWKPSRPPSWTAYHQTHACHATAQPNVIMG